MEIIKKSRETLDKKDLYMMLTSKAIKKMSEAPETLKIEDYVIYNDVRRDTGEIQKLISIKSDQGVFASNSITFIECFESIVECFGSDFKTIKIFKEKSNRGREFLNCTYVD